MKSKTLLSLLIIGFMVSAFGQKSTIELTFTAVGNGLSIPLDSIYIENLTQGGDTMLYAPENTLVIDYVSGILDNEGVGKNKLSVSQNHPNPFTGKTEFDLYLPEKESVKITGRGILGKELVNYEDILNQGNHSFAFYAGNESYYILTVTGKQSSQTIKMLNAGRTITNGEKCKLVYTGNKGYVSGIKLKKEINNFVFYLGDELRYTGYAMTSSGSADIAGNAVIVDSPQTSINYEFMILKGIRCPEAPTVTDIDGNVYNTVQIGDQCWMTENLKTTTYKNGTAIPNVTDADAWSNLSTGAYVWYNNDASWKDLYGALYNWHAGIDTNGLCPTGWHVPTASEWTYLINSIGGFSVSPHGNELKSCRQTLTMAGGACETYDHPRWDFYIGYINGSDIYGFSGLPGGVRSSNGSFEGIGQTCDWYSSNGTSSTNVWHLYLQFDNDKVREVSPGYSDERPGFSVRCLRD